MIKGRGIISILFKIVQGHGRTVVGLRARSFFPKLVGSRTNGSWSIHASQSQHRRGRHQNVWTGWRLVCFMYAFWGRQKNNSPGPERTGCALLLGAGGVGNRRYSFNQCNTCSKSSNHAELQSMQLFFFFCPSFQPLLWGYRQTPHHGRGHNAPPQLPSSISLPGLACLALSLGLPLPIPTLKVCVAVKLITQPSRVHNVVVRGLQAKGLVQPRRKTLHALARAQDESSLCGRGFGHPPYRQSGFGLAVLGEEGWVDDEAVKGGFEGCCGRKVGIRVFLRSTCLY